MPANDLIFQVWKRHHVSRRDDITVTLTESPKGTLVVDAYDRFRREWLRPASTSFDEAKAAADAFVRGKTFGHVCSKDCGNWKRLT